MAMFAERDGMLSEGASNRAEAVIRTFDPCLSCPTHAIDQMPTDIDVRDASGVMPDNRCRG
jgi:NAD-reducing hydrogenase large subunit